MVKLQHATRALFESENVIELAGLYVDPYYRNQGIAGKLLTETYRQAMKLGFNKLHLFTFGDGKLYKNHGWSYQLTKTFHGKPAFIYETELG